MQWNLLRSARDASRGLVYAFRHTRSIQLGTGIAVAALAIGVALRLPVVELVLIVIGWSIGLSLVELVPILIGGTMVLAVETLNTAIEMLCNYVHSGADPRIGRIKDVAAGATAWTELGGALGLLALYAVQAWHLLGH